MTTVHVDDDETSRLGDESHHRAVQRNSFGNPFLLSHATKAGQLTFQECHDFCWKACAIYCPI